MDQFTFTSKQRLFTFGLMALGIICGLIVFFGDTYHHHPRFWTNFLQNSVFFTGIAFVSLYLLAAHTLAYSGWHTVIKRVIEAMSLFLPVGAIFFLILWVGIQGHWHHLYHWAAEGVTDRASANYDAVLAGKEPLLNTLNYLLLTVGLILAWSFFAWKSRKISLEEDKGTSGLKTYQKAKFWLAIFLPVGAFSSAFFIWLSTMSVDAHWYSTMFAWYTTASWLVSAVCIMVLLVMYLNNKGYLPEINQTHRHDLGKYIFAFSIFWTYLWFDQFMLIWYANVGEETIYFKHRMGYFPILFWINLGINFVLPFLVLMRNSTKWKIGSLGFVATAVLFGHWWDFFMMVKPGIWDALHAGASIAEKKAMPIEMGWHIPGLEDIGMGLGFLGLFLFVVLTFLSKAPLIAKHDPYIEESIHHHS